MKTPTNQKNREAAEVEFLDEHRAFGIMRLLKLPGMEERKRTFGRDEAFPQGDKFVHIILSGTVELQMTLPTKENGPKNLSVREFGANRVPDACHLLGIPLEGPYRLVASEEGADTLEFKRGEHDDLLKAAIPFITRMVIVQEGEDLAQMLKDIEWRKNMKEAHNEEVKRLNEEREKEKRLKSEAKTNEIVAKVDATSARHLHAESQRELAKARSMIEELEMKLEDEVNAHLTTRQNLDSTTSLLNKTAEANQQLRKMQPDVLKMIETANAESRRQAERFPEELNKILGAYNLPSRSPEQIMNLLWKLDRGEAIDPAKDLGLAQLDIEVEEDEPITVNDAELLEDGDRHTIPILEPPPSFSPPTPSQVIVSRGRTLPSGETIGTQQGLGESRRKPLLSTQQYPAPKLRPLEPKK